MFKSQSKTEQARAAFAEGLEKAQDHAATAADKATEFQGRAQDAADVARGRAQEARVQAQDAAATARDKAHDFAEYAAPKVESAKDTFVDEVLPKVAQAIATVAAGAVAAKSAATEVAHNAPDAYSVLKGESAAKKKGRGKWVLLLGALAAGAAVAAYRKSTAKPDPWATATPYAPPSR